MSIKAAQATTSQLSIQQLLDALITEKLLAENQQSPIIDLLLTREKNKEIPLYLRILVGIGAFISSWFFIGFMFLAQLISFEKWRLIAWGIAFIIAAIISYKNIESGEKTLSYSFLLQLSFFLMATGKVFFVMGSSLLIFGNDFFHERTFLTLTAITLAVTVVTYPLYPLSFDRFLSVSITLLFLILSTIFSPHSFLIPQEVTITLLFLMFIAGSGVLFTSSAITRDFTPISYALIVALTILIGYLTMRFLIPFPQHSLFSFATTPFYFSLVKLFFALFLMGIIVWATGNLANLKNEPVIVALIGAVALSIVSTYGILFAVGLLILGHARHERLLVIIGGLLLSIFLFFYYYSLHLTLAYKSGILVISGLILLSGYFYLRYRQFYAD